MHTAFKIVFILGVMSIAGCANQGRFGEYMTTDTGSVTVQHGASVTQQGVYSDPLYYNNNAFDSLYFN